MNKSNPKIYMFADEEVEGDNSKLQKETNHQIGTNQLYFYDDVTRTSIYNLNRQLDTTAKIIQALKINFNIKEVLPIELYVSSEGGEVFSAFSAVDRIKSSPIPVNTYVEGIAASAATLLSVCGARRFIRKNAFMLLHQISSAYWGNYMQIKDEVKNLELIMTLVKQIYLQHTTFQESELDELLKHDIYLSAEDCIKYSLADEIL